MKNLLRAASLALAVGVAAPGAHAAEGGAIKDHDFSFEGIFGTHNRAAAQRGLQVYNQVCARCHALERVAFRSLEDLGYTEKQVEAIAAQYKVTDGPNDQGKMYKRTAKPKDRFPPPFKNDKAAAAVYGAVPPDLSVITQARPNGANYLYSLLTGYKKAPKDFELPQGAYYNTAFPGHAIKMPPPLQKGAVEYQDGTEATVAQMAHDVTVFLHWAAEPHMEERKRMGIGVILFLLVFTGVLYATKRKIWQDVEH